MYRRLLDDLLNTPFVKRRYALIYVLQYAREKGIWRLPFACLATVRQYGISAFTDTRHILLERAGHRVSREFLRKSLALAANADEETVVNDMKEWTVFPSISVIFPTYNTRPDLLIRAIGSIAGGWYPHWELCIVDDCSTLPATRETLAAYAADPRIHIRYLEKNSGISEASNRAIEMTRNDFIALMDHDDELAPDALYWVARELNAHPATDIIYTDECKVDDAGVMSDVFHKPDWSPETLFNGMYTGHLTVYRKSFLEGQVGLFRKEYDFSQDYDLMLRASEKTTAIRHIRRVLYKWGITAGSASQGEKPYARASNIAALADALRRRGISGEVVALPEANRVKVEFDRTTPVTIIIAAVAPPAAATLLKDSIHHLLNTTSYPAYDILMVAPAAIVNALAHQTPQSLAQPVAQSLASQPAEARSIEFITCPDNANWAEACQQGAAHAKGDILVFYHPLLRPDTPGWLEDLVEGLFLPEVGGVSPRVNDKKAFIHYAGATTGGEHQIGPTFHKLPADVSFYFHLPRWLRDVSVLSDACLAIRAEIFNQAGGFDSRYITPVYAAGDLSFKIREMGYRCLYTPYTQLSFKASPSSLRPGHDYHEDPSPHSGHDYRKYPLPYSAHDYHEESEYLSGKWAAFLQEDPYFTGPMRALLCEDQPELIRSPNW